jgi:hypothetical protein
VNAPGATARIPLHRARGPGRRRGYERGHGGSPSREAISSSATRADNRTLVSAGRRTRRAVGPCSCRRLSQPVGRQLDRPRQLRAGRVSSSRGTEQPDHAARQGRAAAPGPRANGRGTSSTPALRGCA